MFCANVMKWLLRLYAACLYSLHVNKRHCSLFSQKSVYPSVSNPCVWQAGGKKRLLHMWMLTNFPCREESWRVCKNCYQSAEHIQWNTRSKYDGPQLETLWKKKLSFLSSLEGIDQALKRKGGPDRKSIFTMLVTADSCTKKDWHLMDTFHVAKRGKVISSRVRRGHFPRFPELAEDK